MENSYERPGGRGSTSQKQDWQIRYGDGAAGRQGRRCGASRSRSNRGRASLTAEDGIEAAGNGEIRLTGRRTGPYQGLIFYQDPESPPGVLHTFAGTVEKHYEGTICLPTADVKFIGFASGATTSPYSIYIARRFSLIGAGSLSINENYDESNVPLPEGIDDERAVVLIR